jgi:heat shock protein HslJ
MEGSEMPTKSIYLRINQSSFLRVFGLLVAAVMLLAACSPATPTPDELPSNTATPAPTPVVVDVNLLYANSWTLLAYGNSDNPTIVEQGTTITVDFTQDSQINGFAGCNNYMGTFEAAQDGSMTISPLATTRMSCPTGMVQEGAYLAALQNARYFNFDSQGRLNIVFGSESEPEQVLVFARSAKPLTGTNWILYSYGDPASPQPAPRDNLVTALFSPDGFVSGFSGCNQYNASFTLQDTQVTLGPIASTRMACPTGMEFEQTYLLALETAEQITISGQTLTITYDEGAGVLIYTATNLPLEHTLWTLTVLDGEPIEPEANITAIFTPGEMPNSGSVSGFAGCNQYNAGYAFDGSSLSVEPPAITMMACPTGMETEQSYLQALEASESYEILGDKLVLTHPSGALTFTANRTPLAGALWRLVALGDVNDPEAPVEGSSFNAQFIRVPDSFSGVLTGTTGCNEYTAAFAASVDEIKINPPVSTQNRSCAPGLSDQEELYFLALNDATQYRISGNTLTIPYDSEKQALVFEGMQLEEAVRPPLSDLDGTTWYLWYINSTPLAAGTSIYAQFAVNQDGASGTMSGSAGCNSYVASFGLDLGVQTTLNARQVCGKPAGIMEQERTYIDVLSRTFGYWQTGDQLILNTGNGVLTYRRSQAQNSFDQTHLLVGQTWYLVAFANLNSVAGAQEPFTLFNADGTLTGYTGCNTFQGSYRTSIQQIAISNISSTLAACPNSALGAQEQAMLDILNSANNYQVVDTIMQLGGNRGVLNYSLTPIHRAEPIQPPQAVINVSGAEQIGQVITFNGAASSGQVPLISWRWDFGDGGRGSGPVVDHVYKNPGTYRVQMTVSDQRGIQGSSAREISISAPATPEPTPTEAPQPTPVPTATAEPTQPPAATQQPAPTATAEPTQAPEPTSPPEEIPPQAVIQGSSQGYVGEPLTFDASGSTSGSSPIVSYAWNFGDGTSAGPSAESSQTTIFNRAGGYQVSVVVTDENGQSSSATLDVNISTRLNTPVVWTLDRLDDQNLLPGTAITLQFLEGEIAGFAGCNTYRGSYSATQNEDGTYLVTITSLVTTGVSCPADMMKQEALYLTILPTVLMAQIQQNILNLDYPAGIDPDGQPYSEGRLIYYEVGTPRPR